MCIRDSITSSLAAPSFTVTSLLRGVMIFLIGCHVTPLGAASTHVRPDAIRTRKLLLHNEEIIKMIAKVERAGYTIVPLDMHFSKGRVKVQIGLAKGKKQHDKRDTEKERDWEREKGRIMRAHNKYCLLYTSRCV